MSPQSHYILLENLKFSDAEKTSFQLEEINAYIAAGEHDSFQE